jgi:hypothetical protein
MREVLLLAEARLDTFRRRPLFSFLEDRAVAPEARLGFASNLAFFTMSFADLCSLVLRETPARDRFQEIVNAHADEDSHHWRWYLGDLEKLGQDRTGRFTEALRFLWGKETQASRLLTYRMCRLGFGQSSLQKLVLITVMEATAGFGLERTARIAREIALRGGPELCYLGAHHVEEERDHELLTRDVQEALQGASLDEAQRRDLRRVVDEAFDAFEAFVDELFRARLNPTQCAPAPTAPAVP